MESSVVEAIRRNDIPEFIRMVKKNEAVLDLREPNSMNTVLHVASKFGHVDMVSYIITMRPDLVAAENKENETPFHEACCERNANVLKLLLEANNTQAARKVNSANRTALFIACSFGHVEAVTLLLSQPGILCLGDDGADGTCIHIATKGGHKDIVTKLVNVYPEFIQKLDERGNLALHCASIGGQSDITEMMLRLDSKLAEKYNSNGHTALHLAAMNYKFAVLRAFITMAPVSFQCLTRDGDTVLHLAVKHGQYDALLLLISVCNGLPLLCCQDRHGNTILHLAVFEGNHKMAEYLIHSMKVDINARNSKGLTGLDILEQAKRSSENRFLEAMFHRFGGKRSNELSSLPPKVPRKRPLALENIPQRVLKESEIRTFNEGCSPSTSSSLSSPQSRSSCMSSPQSWKSSPQLPDDPESLITTPKYFPDQEVALHIREHDLESALRAPKDSEPSRQKVVMETFAKSQSKKGHKVYAEALQNARNTITLIAILIATVTFSAGINPPGGVFQDHQDAARRGKSIAAETKAFKVFLISNDLALFTSLSIVVFLVSIIPFRRKPQMRLMSIAHKVMLAAVTFMAMSYVAATWITVPTGHGMEMVFVIVLVVSGGTFGTIFICLGKNLVEHWLTKNQWKKRWQMREVVFDHEMGSENSDVASSYHRGYHSY